jgi:hypothetical protein
MRRLAAFILMALAAAPPAAAAQFALAARLGYAHPLGDAETGVPLSGGASGQIPVQLEAAWKITPHLAVTGFGAYGFALVGDALQADCDAHGASCRASDTRAGIVASWTFAPDAGVAPWVGAGSAAEWMTQRVGSNQLTYRGWLAILEGGADWRTGGGTAVGPVLSAGLGQFGSETLTAGGTSASFTVGDPAPHWWISLSVKGSFSF